MNFYLKIFYFFFAYCSISIVAFAQKDTLPDFSIVYSKGNTVFSWYNKHKQIILINIQRSKDRDKNFFTIYSISYPPAKAFKHEYKTAPGDTSSYYRIFILFKDNNYLFSEVKQPKNLESDQSSRKTDYPVLPPINTPAISNRPYEEKVNNEKSSITIESDKKKEITSSSANKKVAATQKEILLKIQTNEKSNLNFINILNLIKDVPRPKNKSQKNWTASPYIFTGNDGNVTISLPDANKKKYAIIFLKEEGRPLFMIPEVKQSSMLLDKSSFLKSGWYYFELRESGKVIERNKFLITKEN